MPSPLKKPCNSPSAVAISPPLPVESDESVPAMAADHPRKGWAEAAAAIAAAGDEEFVWEGYVEDDDGWWVWEDS